MWDFGHPDAEPEHFRDAANASGATRLYERAGMRVRRQHVTYERSLAG